MCTVQKRSIDRSIDADDDDDADDALSALSVIRGKITRAKK